MAIYYAWWTIIAWTVANLVVLGVVVGARLRNSEKPGRVSAGSGEEREQRPSRYGTGWRRVAIFGIVGVCAFVWGLIGLESISMEVDGATSTLSVVSARTSVDAGGATTITLRLHLSSAMPQIWRVYLTLDSARPTDGFSAVVDFSSGPDQVAVINNASVGPGAKHHTITYGYESFEAAHTGRGTHPAFTTISSGRTASFDIDSI